MPYLQPHTIKKLSSPEQKHCPIAAQAGGSAK